MNFRRPCLLKLGVACLIGIVAPGCRQQADSSAERTPPNPTAPALYRPPTGTASTTIARAAPSNTNAADWQSAPFYVLHTELSPALLVHSTAKRFDLFAGMTNYGLGAPTFVAWSTMNGPRTFQRGEKFDVAKMEEGWVLVWWAGAEGWTNWDSPWVVYLQHQPEAMALDEDGLHLEFPREAGDVVLLPLYGYDKPPQQGHDFLAQHGLPAPKVKIKTWEWPKVLTRDPLTRIRYWASATRRFPVYCEDSFSVDRAKDSVTIRSRFTWRSIEDDWKTRPIKLAPISPPLAHAAKLGGFPVTFSKPWFDLEMPTPFGPYLAVEGADEFDATLSVLQYVNETEALDPPVTSAHPTVQLALDKLRSVAGPAIQQLDTLGAGHATAGWLARALPYLDELTRSNTQAALRARLRETSPRSHAYELESLWIYAHVTGDWALVRSRWPQVKQLLVAPGRTRWVGFARDGGATLGGQASSSVAFARLAYLAGDLDSYHYGCYLFARELTHLFLKQRGADYFRKHQPWHSLEFMDEEIFLTHLQSDGAGWRMDGPKFPAAADARRFNERWAGFKDFDVARFYREHLKDDARRELNWLQHCWPPERRWQNDPSGLPSLVQLRALLLNETPAELAAVATPDQFSGGPSGEMASCLSVLRASHPTRYQRLIPPGEPSPFVAGLERDVAASHAALLVAVECQTAEEGAVSWPQLTLRNWRTPDGSPWTFGQIRPGGEIHPHAAKVVSLNWNTSVRVFQNGSPIRQTNREPL